MECRDTGLHEEEQRLTVVEITAAQMARKTTSPYLLFFLLFLMAMALNLLVVVYPLVIEGIIIGAPPMAIMGLDAWVAHIFFGIPLSETFSAYAFYIPFLLDVYLLSFLPGFIIGLRLVWPTFRKLLRNREIIASEKRLAARVLLDFILFGWFGILALTRILAFVVQYPGQLNGVTPLSLMTGYIMTGFISGSCTGKSILALWVYFYCMKHGLKLVSFHVEQQDSVGKPKHRDLVKWALAPTRRQ